VQLDRVDLYFTVCVLSGRNLPGLDRAQNGVFVAANGRGGCCKAVHGVPTTRSQCPTECRYPPLIKGDHALIAGARRSAANPKTLARNKKTGSIELV